MIRNFWIKYVLLMRNPATPSGQTIGGIVCALITFRTQTSKFIINKQPRSLYHTESLDPSVAETRTLRLIRGGWCSQDRGGVGVSTLLIFSCLGAFQGKGGEGGISKCMVMVERTFKQKRLKVSGDLAADVIRWLRRKRGDGRLSHWCGRLGSPWPQPDI